MGTKRRWLVVCLLAPVVAALCVASTAPASSAATSASSATSTFTDPSGDAGGAPDVSTAAVNGDTTSGVFSLAVTALGFTPTSANFLPRSISVFLDTDKNAATGSQSGCEYALSVGANSPSDAGWDMLRWDGSAWQSMPQSATMNFALSNDVATWTFSKADIGGAGGFSFYVSTSIRDASGAVSGRDVAPDAAANGTRWTFDLTAPAPTPIPTPAPTPTLTFRLVIQAPATTPGTAVAGRAFSVRFPVGFLSKSPAPGIDAVWMPLPNGRMICDPSVAGKVIRHAESLRNGVAKLSFVIPTSAKGKLLKMKLTVKIPAGQTINVANLSATKVVTFRVR